MADYPIIFVSGSANPAYLEREVRQENAVIAALREAGNKVVTVGSACTGFTLAQFNRALMAYPDANTIIISAHGNIKNGQHYVAARPWKEKSTQRERIWAKDIYKAIATHRAEPQNILMLSCGSGNGCEAGVQHLPLGSTLASFVDPESVNHYVISPEAFAVPPGEGLAESLFLNLLCRNTNTHNGGWLSVATNDRQETTIWSLWDECRMGEFSAIDDIAPLIAGLAAHCTPEEVESAAATMRLYMRHFDEKPVLTDPLTPVTFEYKPDHEAFRKSAAQKGILGVMCAIGYLQANQMIGAFQSWPAERYKTVMPQEPTESCGFSTFLKGLNL